MSARRTAILIGPWLAALAVSGAVGAAEPSPAWSAQAEQGRALYYGTQQFARGATVAAAPLPASVSACVQCHGPLGAGSREANLAAPDVRTAALQARGVVLADALRDGRGAAGRSLHPAMPRYSPTVDELAALQAFWPWLGDAAQPQRGLDSNEIRLGLVLDGITHASARRQVATGVQEMLDRANAAGGVHGRQLRLIQSQQRLPDDVFVLVASALTPSQKALLPAQRLPSLAALDVLPRDADPAGWQWPLLPSLAQQARIAARQLENTPAGCARHIVDPRRMLEAIQPNSASPAWPAGTRLCVAALAPSPEVDLLRAHWRDHGIELQQLIELSGLRPRPLAERGLDHRLVLFVPLSVADQAERHALSLWQVLGQAAARTVIEVLARSGRAVVPESLSAQMPSLGGYSPLPDAPLAYSASMAHGWLPEIYAPPTPPDEPRPPKELP